MLKLYGIAVTLFLLSLVAGAQDLPKVEAFGGFQFANLDGARLGNRLNVGGWNVDVAGHVTKDISIVADFSGAEDIPDFTDVPSGTKLRAHTYLFGPRFSVNAGRIRPFAEALFGIAHATVEGTVVPGSGNTTSNGFGMAIGGGLDVNAYKHLAFRVAKIDYLLTQAKFSSTGDRENLNNVRFATGVVVKF